MPARPAIIEIYGNYLPSRGHKIIWITLSRENRNNVIDDLFRGVKIYTVPYPFVSYFPLRFLRYIKYNYDKFKLISMILNEESFDIIQTRNNILDSIMAIYFKKKV